MPYILCMSDLHGRLPNLETEVSGHYDMVVIGGDICPDFRDPAGTGHGRTLGQAQWLDTTFRRWLETIAVPVVGVAGNHDVVFEWSPHLVPPDLRWTYLQDDVKEVAGLKIFGSPWQPPFGTGWAFNLDEAGRLRRWSAIPEGIDIALLHGPPFGHGDLIRGEGHQGCRILRERLDIVKPKLVVSGHIHEAYGIYEGVDTKYVNASTMTRWLEPVNPLQIVRI